MKLSKPELIAVLLYVPGKTGHIGEPIVGRTRLMKLIFLLLKEGGLAEDVDKATSFKPYRYGPFDPEVFDCIEALKELNIVEEKATPQSKIGDETLEDIDETYDAETTYTLTPQGIAKVERIVRQLPANVLRIISNYKSIYGDKPLIEILHYVYGKYPKYAELSEANI